MNQEQREERITHLQQMIKMETEEKARMIVDEVKLRANKEKNKQFNADMDKLNKEFEERQAQEATNKKLEKSRKNNEIRLDVQKYRSELIERLRADLDERIKTTLKDKQKYKAFLKELILQGLVRLLETNVKIRSTKNDLELIRELLPEVKQEYAKFMKEKIDKDVTIELTLFEKSFLSEEYMGGVILYCNNNKIVFDNSIRARIELTLQSSTPDIRRIMFTSLSLPKMSLK